MPTKIWTAGEELKAADVNQYLSNQTVMTFADAAARTAAIPAPTVGMITYLSSTGYLEIYTDKTSPPSWRPPWSAAWGLTASGPVTDRTLIATYAFIVPGGTIPVQVPGRLYKVEFDINTMVTGGATFFRYRFQNGGSLDTIGEWTTNSGWSLRVLLHDTYIGSPSNSLGVICQADQNCITSWGRWRVFDMGPV